MRTERDKEGGESVQLAIKTGKKAYKDTRTYSKGKRRKVKETKLSKVEPEEEEGEASDLLRDGEPPVLRQHVEGRDDEVVRVLGEGTSSEVPASLVPQTEVGGRLKAHAADQGAGSGRGVETSSTPACESSFTEWSSCSQPSVTPEKTQPLQHQGVYL